MFVTVRNDFLIIEFEQFLIAKSAEFEKLVSLNLIKSLFKKCQELIFNKCFLFDKCSNVLIRFA